MSHYTDANVQAGRARLLRVSRFASEAEQVRAVLDAVAPAIAARALREAADWLEADDYVRVPDQLRDRADEIEQGQP